MEWLNKIREGKECGKINRFNHLHLNIGESAYNSAFYFSET